jgi:hypothetical protein
MSRPIWIAAGVRTPFTRVDGGLAKRDAIGLGVPVLRAMALGKVPDERMNPNGGSVALGHPFGATGARILSQTVKELATMKQGARALVSICADGGVGAVALLEA